MENKSFEELSLQEILFLNDKQKYNRYMNELEGLGSNRLSRAIISKMSGSSLAEIYMEILKQEQFCRSLEFFPDDLILLYGGIKEYKSRKMLTCDFSGALIYPHSSYIAYRPILENISRNEVYVLKRTLKVESGYEYNLPTNIHELETLQRNIYLEQDLNDGINYSHLSQRVGGELVLKKLNKKRGSI